MRKQRKSINDISRYVQYWRKGNKKKRKIRMKKAKLRKT